jgi:hypothetical protein
MYTQLHIVFYFLSGMNPPNMDHIKSEGTQIQVMI